MSLVGTRPPTVDEWDKYELHHRARLATKPGLTGMWQVSGRSNITDFEEVVKLDKQYISEEPVVSYCTDSVTLQSVTSDGMNYSYSDDIRMRSTRELFSCTVLYIFIFSLLTASPFNSVLSKYMSDVIYEETYEDNLLI